MWCVYMCIYDRESEKYYPALKKKEILTYATTWMELEELH